MSLFVQFFFKLCTLCAVTTSSLNAFHFSTILCRKLYLPISFTHCLFRIFFACPLVLPASVTSTLSIFSMPFTILYIVIRSPCSLLSCKVDSPISLSLSSYVRALSSSIIFLAIF
ncbi:hypothetical protein E2C01_045285 [Portunus trituberculatus]|uniref:Uncharacterized protein n=1 Tax=Portunus trituberculatus TaxID=210409 RepID=A0A5B7FUK1_PORTR|nr:hypothetical protein [Portunus trituberculatus]